MLQRMSDVSEHMCSDGGYGGMRCIGTGLVVGAALFLSVNSAFAQPVSRPANALTFFGAWMTGSQWQDFFTPSDLRFRKTYMAGVGYDRRLTTLFDALDVGGLGQVAPHFGAAHQWEFDLAANVRWTNFPWNDVVPTTVAFALGTSYETQVPREEEPLNSSGSKQWLAFWLLEVEVSAPDSLWSGVIRLHHRSTAFGLFGQSGGSNWLALGVRRYF